MSENNEEHSTQDSEATEAPDASQASFQEIVEIPWEKVEGVFRIRENMYQNQQQLSGFLLEMERRKLHLLDRLAEMENSLYAAANQLKQECETNPEWTYELKLPQNPEEKAYLVRKEE